MDITLCDRDAKRRAATLSLLMELAGEGAAGQMMKKSQPSAGWPAALARSSPVRRVRALFRLWRRRAQERAELAQLSERDLRDIGLSDWDARHEANKWFWQA